MTTCNSPPCRLLSPVTSSSVSQNRAKENRQRFRKIIDEIKELICDGEYSTNQVLSQAIAHIALSKFDESHQKSSNLSLFDTEEILKSFNSIGFGVTAEGKIVFTSKNFPAFFGTKNCFIGNHISLLVGKSHEFMYQVFHHRQNVVLCTLNCPGNNNSKFILRGKFLKDGNGNELFLVAAEKVEPLANTLTSLFSAQEILLDESFGFLNKSYTYLDKFLGFNVHQDNFLDYIVDDDLFSCFGNIKNELLHSGYKDTVIRHYCSDGCLLFVHIKIFSMQSASGSTIMVCYCIPYAFGVSDPYTVPNIIEHGLRMLNSTDAWLSHLPSHSSLKRNLLTLSRNCP
ncbi:hypothetical protein ACHWQZ_G002820 [Mnemiopsis leidyi]